MNHADRISVGVGTRGGAHVVWAFRRHNTNCVRVSAASWQLISTLMFHTLFIIRRFSKSRLPGQHSVLLSNCCLKPVTSAPRSIMTQDVSPSSRPVLNSRNSWSGKSCSVRPLVTTVCRVLRLRIYWITAYKGWSSNLGVVLGTNNSSP
jgi:hypothetical protein